jgi:cation diffusion facilitator family transporter
MSDCGCHPTGDDSPAQRVLWIALGLNAAMAVIETVIGVRAESTGLLADALDMLSDASAYAIALLAVGRSASFKAGGARLSGILLLLLGIGVLLEVGRRAIYGSEPEANPIIATAVLALIVNATVLMLLRPSRRGEVHMRAAWIFTRADVVANLGVILSGVLVAVTGVRYPDLVVGSAIGIYVIKEAVEILREAREAKARAAVQP